MGEGDMAKFMTMGTGRKFTGSVTSFLTIFPENGEVGKVASSLRMAECDSVGVETGKGSGLGHSLGTEGEAGQTSVGVRGRAGG